MRKLAPVVALAALVAAAAAFASAPTSRRAAIPLARRVLAALRLPAGATRAHGDFTGGRLRHPGQAPLTPNLVDLHSFWRVPEDPASVYQWLLHNPPPGWKPLATGEGTQNGAFTYGLVVYGSSLKSLVVATTAAPGGGAAVRADAEVVWLFVRPRSERVPSGIRMVTITSQRPGGRRSGPIVVSAPRTVRRIVTLVNRLPAAQPGVASCSADIGPYVAIEFRRAAAQAPVAVATADDTGCGSVTFTLNGRREHLLTDGPRLIARLEALLRVRF